MEISQIVSLAAKTSFEALTDRRNLSTYTATQRPLVLAEAVALYLSRRDRRSHPAGNFDKRMRWYPSSQEQCSCCALIRTPSAAHPYSLMVHCRTAEHIAYTFGISTDDLKSAVRRAEASGDDSKAGDESKIYKAWLSARAPFSPLVDLSGQGKVAKKTASK